MRKGAKTYGLYGIKNINLSNDLIVRKDLKYSDVEYHFNNKDIIIPDYQRELDHDKIQEIVEEVKLNNGYLNNCTNPIQIASIQINDTEWSHYILDGQHRFMAITKLADLFPDLYQSFVLHQCKTENDAIIIFEKLIKGQEKLYLLSKDVFNNDFRESRQFKFREYLKTYYSNHFANSEKNKWVYTIDSFLQELGNKNFFQIKKYNTIIKIKDYLFKKLIKFSMKVEYERITKDSPKLLYKKELDILNICDYNCLGLKNNNFIDYIFTSKNNKISAHHNWKVCKEVIPKQIKTEVWQTYYNTNNKKCCPITDCKKIITNVNFSTGHIISEANKGTLKLDNLHPICVSCNSKMGTKNWQLFDEYSYQKIIKQQEILDI